MVFSGVLSGRLEQRQGGRIQGGVRLRIPDERSDPSADRSGSKSSLSGFGRGKEDFEPWGDPC